MKVETRGAAGALLFLSFAPSIAQETVSKVSSSANCASCPGREVLTVKVEGDPTLLVAAMIVIAVVSATAGYLVGRNSAVRN